eukprot:comp20988_c0_seq1/m.43942 comp20988_c0_seq1/g.43942  ORF comp20988_c0_seq1/g.43942 comp20988_c0_seq1/m.43942 type:complete len:361 (+) comp20988_c0_seq1:22-1104(+)
MTDKNNNKVLRFGLISTSRIGDKVIAAIRHAGHVVTAVASRDIKRAEEYAAQNKIPKAMLYNQLISEPTVDAVYIPIPTGLRREWAISAANHKKHVLCEKPFASTEDVETIVKACFDNGVMFMDGTMWMHHPRTLKMKSEFPHLGKIQHVMTTFSFTLTDYEDIRLKRALEPHGALGDIGWYNVKAILWAFDWVLPESVFCSAQFHRVKAGEAIENSVISSCEGILTFADGRAATFHCSFNEVFNQILYVTGEKGQLSVDDFVLTSDMSFNNYAERQIIEEYRIKEGSSTERVVPMENVCMQEVEMIKTFAKEALIKPQPGQMARFCSESILTQVVIDALDRSARTQSVVKIDHSKVHRP